MVGDGGSRVKHVVSRSVRRRTLLVGIAGLATGGGCIETQSENEDGERETPIGPDSNESDDRQTDDEGTDERFYESGTIEIVIDGSPVDLSADRFQAEHNPDHDIRFHFHEGDDNWHMEEERVTFSQAIDLIPFFTYERRDDAHVVTYDGETYDAGEPSTEIVFRVEGEAVDPTAHELHDGEHVELEISISE